MSYVPQTPLVEQRHAGGFIVSLANGHQSIDHVLLMQGSGRLQPGVVIGYASGNYAAAGVATVGNTGDGTLSGIAVVSPALAGTYTISLISATEFTVANPNGEVVPAQGGTVDVSEGVVVVGAGTVGAVFNAQGIGFVVTTGTAAFIAGDSFTIVVTDTGGGWAPITGTSGDVTAYGLLYGVTDTTSGPANAAAVVRQAEVNASELVWDASLSAAQQNSVTAALQAQGILSR